MFFVFFFIFLWFCFLFLWLLAIFTNIESLACKLDLYEMIFVTIWFLLCRWFRPRTGFDKSSLERLEQLFRKTVGNEKEIRREDFKKIVTSKNVRCCPIVLYFSYTCEDSSTNRYVQNFNVYHLFKSHSSRIGCFKYSTKTIQDRYHCKNSLMPFINLLVNHPKIR